MVRTAEIALQHAGYRSCHHSCYQARLTLTDIALNFLLVVFELYKTGMYVLKGRQLHLTKQNMNFMDLLAWELAMSFYALLKSIFFTLNCGSKLGDNFFSKCALVKVPVFGFM